ncbi:MAG: protein translocase subunit SecF [Nitrospinota bacterium]
MNIIKSNINFIAYKKKAFIISCIVIAVSLLSLIAHGGPNYGIDFRGGLLIQLKFIETADIKAIRDDLKALGIGDFSVQQFGSKEDVIINTELDPNSEPDSARLNIEKIFKTKYQDKVIVDRVEMVGPKIGGDLRKKAVLALIYALVGILIYVTFRFQFGHGLAAIVALAHDATVTIGIFSILDKEFTLPVVAALLTVIGYSLNDTIVVFDRIRENLRLKRGKQLSDIINISINQTMSRTVLTSGTTLFVVLSILFFGGQVIHDFAFALFIGVVVGTYSSIFVAAPLLVEIDKYKKPKKA